MNKTFDYLGRIDAVLFFLAKSFDAKPFISHVKLVDDFNKDKKDKVSGDVLQKILNKLEKDEYVYKELREGIALYSISWEGLLQNELGGYKALHSAEIRLKRITITTFILTLSIALGAFFASIYYIIEISKYFC